MLKGILRAILFVIGLFIVIFAERLRTKRSVFSALSITSFAAFVSIFTTPFWQQALETIFGAALGANASSAPAWLAALIFLILTFLFAYFAHKASRQDNSESLVHTRNVSPPIQIGASEVMCYCGTIEQLKEAQVIVTSENQGLELGSINGTSVSGRVRRMAADFDDSGRLISDNMHEYVTNWKTEKANLGPFPLGTCVLAPPFNAAKSGVEAIILSVAVEKRDSGKNIIDEQAIHKIITYALSHCQAKGFSSLFIPVFGIGSGGERGADAISKTITPLVEQLRNSMHKMQIYVGTYRTSDQAATMGKIFEKIK